MSNGTKTRDPRVNMGDVFYDNLGEGLENYPFWQTYREWALTDFNSKWSAVNLDKTFDVSIIVNRLKTMCRNELEKEKQALSIFFNVPRGTITLTENTTAAQFNEYIVQLNRVMNVNENWIRTVRRLQAQDSGEKENTDERKVSGSRGNNFAAIFGNYLHTAIGRLLAEEFTKDETIELFLEGDQSGLKSIIDKLFDRAIKEALLGIEKGAKGEGMVDTPYVELTNLLNEYTTIANNLNHEIYTNFNLPGLKEDIMKEIQGQMGAGLDMAKMQLSDKVSIAMKGKIGSYMKGRGSPIVGGIIDEFFQMLGTLQKRNLNEGVAIKSITRTGDLGLAAASTDILTELRAGVKSTLEASVEIPSEEVQRIADALGGTAVGTIDKKGRAAETIQAITDHIQSHGAGSLLIHESVKAYGLKRTSHEQVFHGTTYTLASARNLLEQIGVERAEDLISLIINTSEKTLFEDAGRAQTLSNVIAQYFAYFLFDDYRDIGAEWQTNSGNSIHIFTLSQVKVPLSYLLYRTACAFEQARVITNKHTASTGVRMVFKSPKPLERYYGQYPLSEDILEESSSAERWEEQRKAYESGFKIRTDFLPNFRKFLVDDIGAILDKGI